MRSSRWISALTASLLLAALAPNVALSQGLALDTVEVASDLDRPVSLAQANDGSGRLFVVEQTGRVRILEGGLVLATPYLDLAAMVDCCNERGLLGLAFHPNYASNGEFFVHYTRDNGNLESVLARYTVSADPDVADATSAQVLLVQDQPAGNHNGGQLAFGPDGYLYVATGDGGGGGDPFETGQDLGSLLGKILRLDVDDADPGLAYAIPPSNPFVGVAGARPEIWAYGLRNPWRFSFDRATGDLWIGDVGQQNWEEIDLQAASSEGGENYGWDCREGAHPYNDTNGDDNTTCPASGFTDPVLEYFQDSGRCSVTGGFRYRGVAEPRLAGVYLYADFCTGEVFGTVPRCDGGWESRVLLDAPFNITAFGEDEAGEVYVTEFAGTSSKIHLLTLAAGSGGPNLVVAPSLFDFGDVASGDQVSTLLTLSNTNGGPAALALDSVVLSDPRFRLDYQAGANPCRNPRRCLAPGESCTLSLSFRSTTQGDVIESLTLEGNFTAELITLDANVTPCATSADLTVSGQTVDGAATAQACDTLTVGPGVTIAASGSAQFCGGTTVIFESGFAVDAGGAMRVSNALDCPLS